MQRLACGLWRAKTHVILRTLCASYFLLLFILLNLDNGRWLFDRQPERFHVQHWWFRPNVSETHNPPANAKDNEWDWAKDVSVVYTWVNGSDPDLTAKRILYGGPEFSGLYRDHDDLRYSLKTWLANAPWHRGKIFVVSQTAPTWLNQSHPRIQWICQDELLPHDVTPTFSNYVVEQYLYSIPGLSQQFIHMNDDYMVDRPTTPADFFTTRRGPKFYFDNAYISPDVETSGGSQWLQCLLTTMKTVDAHYAQETGAFKTRYRYLKHAPYVYDQKAYYRVHEVFQEQLLETSLHRFRTAGDILWPYLYYGFLVNEGTQCCEIDFEFVRDGPGKAFLLMWSTDMRVNREAMKQLDARKPLFLTINDDMGVEDQDAIRTGHHTLLQFYEQRYGHLAGVFEKDYLSTLSQH